MKFYIVVTSVLFAFAMTVALSPKQVFVPAFEACISTFAPANNTNNDITSDSTELPRMMLKVKGHIEEGGLLDGDTLTSLEGKQLMETVDVGKTGYCFQN